MEENNKPTYEQLEQMVLDNSQRVRELMNRNMMLQNQLGRINTAALTMKLLFKVLKYKDSFPSAFVQTCVDEIMDMMNPENEETEKLSSEE